MCAFNDGECLIKIVRRYGGQLCLESLNRAFNVIVVTGDFHVEGEVKQVLRRLVLDPSRPSLPVVPFTVGSGAIPEVG